MPRKVLFYPHAYIILFKRRAYEQRTFAAGTGRVLYRVAVRLGHCLKARVGTYSADNVRYRTRTGKWTLRILKQTRANTC